MESETKARSASDRDGRGTNRLSKAELILGTGMSQNLSRGQRHAWEIFGKIIADKKPIVDLESWNLTKDGRQVCLLTSGIPLLDDDGNVIGYRGVDKDITDHKEAEEKLKQYMDDLERFNRLAVDRENQVISLKQEINALLEKLGQEPKFESVE